MKDDADTDPWKEEPVIEREGYQLRPAEEIRDDWRTILIVAAMVVLLSLVAVEAFGGDRAPARMPEQIQSR